MKKGFSLIEIVMAASIFAIASVTVAAAFVQTTRSQKKILLENALFEDSRFVMERLTNEIRNNTIDYEEYHNQIVKERQLGAETYYGKNFGEYGKKFYNPGRNAGAADAYGALCNNGDRVAHRGIPPEDCVILKQTVDTNTGQNPYLPSPEAQDAGFNNSLYIKTATAMCDNGVPGVECTDLALQRLYRQNELYLINRSGNLKTIFALEKTKADPAEYALAMVKMDGRDTADSDDLPDTFSCSSDFKCTVVSDGNKYPLNEDLVAPVNLEILGENFTPISPERVTIKDLHFFISPLEDPRKAFAENLPEIQMQPHVTIVMTIALTDKYAKQVPGENFEITLQTTVSSGIYQEVISY